MEATHMALKVLEHAEASLASMCTCRCYIVLLQHVLHAPSTQISRIYTLRMQSLPSHRIFLLGAL